MPSLAYLVSSAVLNLSLSVFFVFVSIYLSTKIQTTFLDKSAKFLWVLFVFRSFVSFTHGIIYLANLDLLVNDGSLHKWYFDLSNILHASLNVYWIIILLLLLRDDAVENKI